MRHRFPRRPDDIVDDKISSAGPSADAISAAAMAFVLADIAADFENLPHAELGGSAATMVLPKCCSNKALFWP